MAAAKITEKLSTLITCSICFEEFAAASATAPTVNQLTEMVWSGQGGVTDVKFLASCYIIVVRYGRLRILDMSGKQISHPISSMHKGYAGRIAVDKNTSSVAVISYVKPDYDGYLDLYMKDGDHWQHKCHEICKHPISVCFTEEGDVIVGDNYGYLYLYNEGHKQMWKRKLSSVAKCIAVNQQNVILVGCDNKVVAYHAKGNRLFTIMGKPSDIDVRGICVDSDDQIWLADQKTDSLLLYGNNGCYQKKILSFEKGLECIALFNDEYLAVVLSHRLYLYKCPL